MTDDLSSPAAALVYGRRFTLDGVDSHTLERWSQAVATEALGLVLVASGSPADADGPRYGEGVVGVVWSRLACSPSSGDEPATLAVPAWNGDAPIADLDALDGVEGPAWADADGRPLQGWFLLPIGWSAAVLCRGDEELVVTSAEDTEVAAPIDPEILRQGGLTLISEPC